MYPVVLYESPTPAMPRTADERVRAPDSRRSRAVITLTVIGNWPSGPASTSAIGAGSAWRPIRHGHARQFLLARWFLGLRGTGGCGSQQDKAAWKSGQRCHRARSEDDGRSALDDANPLGKALRTNGAPPTLPCASLNLI